MGTDAAPQTTPSTPSSTRRQRGRLVETTDGERRSPTMTTPEHQRIIQLPVAAQPLRRRRSRFGEPTVRIELVVIDSNGELGRQLLRRQAAAVKDALQWFAHHPPTDEPDQHLDTKTEAR